MKVLFAFAFLNVSMNAFAESATEFADDTKVLKFTCQAGAKLLGLTEPVIQVWQDQNKFSATLSSKTVTARNNSTRYTTVLKDISNDGSKSKFVYGPVLTLNSDVRELKGHKDVPHSKITYLNQANAVNQALDISWSRLPAFEGDVYVSIYWSKQIQGTPTSYWTLFQPGNSAQYQRTVAVACVSAD